MLLGRLRGARAIVRTVVWAVSLATFVLYLCTPQQTLQSFDTLGIPGRIHPRNFTAASGFSPQLNDFWQDLGLALEAARPDTPPIGVENGMVANLYKDYDPLMVDKKPPERLSLTDEIELDLLRAHYLMRTEAQRLGPLLPYVHGSRGIVATVRDRYLSMFMISLRMIRRTGCDLPVEVFLDDWSQYNAKFCEEELPSLNARCRILSDIYNKATGVAPIDYFQYKIFSILFSSFQHVLFLDADSFPAHDPTDLFDNAPYTTHGLVIWPDIFDLTVSPHYYHIAGLAEIPVSSRYSSETGQVLLNKEVHKESLMMMVYYNYYGPDYYYPLLCQGSEGAGDKETFLPAAEVMGMPWYQVRLSVDPLGQFNEKGHLAWTAFSQRNPKEDFQYGAPHPSHNHDREDWVTEVNNPRIKSSPPKPRGLFIHHTVQKFDPSIIIRHNGPTRDDKGRRQRIYGDKESILMKFDYDVEERLWDVISEVGCDANQGLCEELKSYTDEVFGGHVGGVLLGGEMRE